MYILCWVLAIKYLIHLCTLTPTVGMCNQKIRHQVTWSHFVFQLRLDQYICVNKTTGVLLHTVLSSNVQ